MGGDPLPFARGELSQDMRRMSGPLPAAVAARGMLLLLTESDPASGQARRVVRLEATADGRTLLLVDVDLRKPGIQAKCATRSRRPN